MDKITCEQLNSAMKDYCIVMFSVSKLKHLKEIRWHPFTDLFSVRVIKPSPYISSTTEGIASMEQAVKLYNTIII